MNQDCNPDGLEQPVCSRGRRWSPPSSLVAHGASVDADAQRTALLSEAARRSVVLPVRFDVPVRSLRIPGYAAEARRSVLDVPTTLDDALDVVRPFLDPVLDGTSSGVWDPDAGRWTGAG